MSIYREQIKSANQEISLEVGQWAKQAHGSLVYRCGKLVLLATVCAEKRAKEGQSFFPLTVDYREKFYAAGRIPGGYFKRESRPAEHETLLSRLIDRPCRPLFPEGYFCEVQLLVNLLSYDPDQPVEGHAITAASAVLMASDIPWDGPIAGVLVGRCDGKFIADPNAEQRQSSDIDLLVAGSRDAITMIEGNAKEYSDADMIAALEFARSSIIHKLDVQEQLVKSMSVQKREVELRLADKDVIKSVHDFALTKMQAANQTKIKLEREEKIAAVYDETLLHFKAQFEASDSENAEAKLKEVKEELHTIEYLAVRSLIFDQGIRADGRKLDEIREISVQTDVLPGAHGSAVFTRGQTQSLGVVTLGTKMDNQRYDSLEGQKIKNFMLHYNFPPFSTGEVKRMMGPGRREIGHGNLALRSLKEVLPTEEAFPYVIRVVSEILESNGSSSMASVCSGSLAMMAAGVPISAPVAGIAMGLMSDGEGNIAILSDIAGLEDHFGDMDLKVAGSEKGITAFQLDLKIKGLGIDTIAKALEQAKEGRLHILKEMNKVCSSPRDDIPEGAPRIYTMQIDSGRIGELIGPGGKIIREISERSGAEVSVEDSGTVTIASASKAANETAQKMIDNIFREVQAGDNYEGTVKRIVEFGAFVELYPGKEGLLHISKMSSERVQSVGNLFQEGDNVPVIVLGIDHMGRVDLGHRDVDAGLAEARRSNGGFSHNSDRKPAERSHSSSRFDPGDRRPRLPRRSSSDGDGRSNGGGGRPHGGSGGGRPRGGSGGGRPHGGSGGGRPRGGSGGGRPRGGSGDGRPRGSNGGGRYR